MIIGKIIYREGDGVAEIRMNEKFTNLESTIRFDLADDILAEADDLRDKIQNEYRADMASVRNKKFLK